MKETELGEYIAKFFDGYDLYKEVSYYGNRIDLIAVKGKITIAVELKTILSFDVIKQAYRNKPAVSYSYIGIPHVKHHFGIEICEHLGVGVLMLGTPISALHDIDDHIIRTYEQPILQMAKPSFNRNPHNIVKYLKEYQKLNTAGTQLATHTAFSNTVKLLTLYVTRHQGCTLKDAIESIDHHYASFSGAKNSICLWIAKGVIKNIIMKDGKLYLK